MTRWACVALIACVLAAGCSDDDSTGPSGQPLVFTAILSPANEVPAITNAESGGQGAMQVQFDVTRDASNVVTGGTATFYFQLSGFPADTRTQAAHIHSAGAGVNGPIVVDTGITQATALVITGGIQEFRSGPVTMTAATANAIIANPSAFYFNVHSPLNPGGFARGQLTRIQ
jgi:hypothetical protein